MKFSDNIIRQDLDTVFVIRTEEEMQEREEAKSNLWEIRKRKLFKKGG